MTSLGFTSKKMTKKQEIKEPKKVKKSTQLSLEANMAGKEETSTRKHGSDREDERETEAAR